MTVQCLWGRGVLTLLWGLVLRLQLSVRRLDELQAVMSSLPFLLFQPGCQSFSCCHAVDSCLPHLCCQPICIVWRPPPPLRVRHGLLTVPTGQVAVGKIYQAGVVPCTLCCYLVTGSVPRWSHSLRGYSSQHPRRLAPLSGAVLLRTCQPHTLPYAGDPREARAVRSTVT